MKQIVLLGAGSHAQVVMDLLDALGKRSDRISALDLSTAPWHQSPAHSRKTNLPSGWLNWHALLGRMNIIDWRQFSAIASKRHLYIPAIGNPKLREWISKWVQTRGYSLSSAAHPAASISRKAVVEKGVVVCAGAVVSTGAHLDEGAILNTGCIVDHDCRIGPYAHIAPGARLAGNVVVGARAWVGIGASVREGVRIGPDAIVGAGAVVVRDVPAGKTVAGIPARKLKVESRK